MNGWKAGVSKRTDFFPGTGVRYCSLSILVRIERGYYFIIPRDFFTSRTRGLSFDENVCVCERKRERERVGGRCACGEREILCRLSSGGFDILWVFLGG